MTLLKILYRKENIEDVMNFKTDILIIYNTMSFS